MFNLIPRKKTPFQRSEIPNPFKDFSGKLIDEFEANPIFITGVGRSGTHFLASLFNNHPRLSAFHLDEVGNPVGDSFFMYSLWYGLEMDYSAFFASRNYLIRKAKGMDHRFLESNPYLVFAVELLYHKYPKAQFIIPVRSPRKVVLSHYNKGWYENFYPEFQPQHKAPFYQYQIPQANHFFGRIFPKEAEAYQSWLALTQVGKISWMWHTINQHILDLISRLGTERIQVLPIESFGYEEYTRLCVFLREDTHLSEKDFEELRRQKPGKTKVKRFNSWGDLEEQEFNQYTKPILAQLSNLSIHVS